MSTVAEIIARHVLRPAWAKDETDLRCLTCHNAWPCDVARVADGIRKELADELRAGVGPGVKHSGGSAGVYEFTPNGTSTEFWSYGNAVAYTSAVNEILLGLDPESTFGTATTYAGGRAEPRTLQEALEKQQ